MISMQIRQERFGYLGVTGDPLPIYPGNKQISVSSMALINGSVSSSNLGLGMSYSTDASAVFGSVGGVQTPLVSGAYFSAVGDMVYFQARNRFDFLSFKNSTAAAGLPIYDLEYWNGTTWAALLTESSSTYIEDSSAIVFGPPIDWVTGAGLVSDLDETRYTVRLVVATAGTTTPIASAVYICKLLSFREEVESKQSIEASFDPQQFLAQGNQLLIPYFSVADYRNSVEVGYRISG